VISSCSTANGRPASKVLVLKSPAARAVPRVQKTGTPNAQANAAAPPTWSACSWVTRTASRRSGSMPM
jgi:hypothetical protein